MASIVEEPDIGIEGTLISYATQPGNVALDGSDGDSPYTKPEYRLALARDGYALVRCALAVFKPEV